MKRGKVPSLLSKGIGRPVKVVVQRKSTCKRCGCALFNGSSCFQISINRNGLSIPRRYCFKCMEEIINQTEKELLLIKSELYEKK